MVCTTMHRLHAWTVFEQCKCIEHCSYFINKILIHLFLIVLLIASSTVYVVRAYHYVNKLGYFPLAGTTFRSTAQNGQMFLCRLKTQKIINLGTSLHMIHRSSDICSSLSQCDFAREFVIIHVNFRSQPLKQNNFDKVEAAHFVDVYFKIVNVANPSFLT